MANPIELGTQLTGWYEDVVAFLYDEFCEQDGDDFREFLADHTAQAAFVIAASEGLSLEMCLEAAAQGRACVLEDDFDLDEAVEAIKLAEVPDDDASFHDDDDED